MRKTLITGFAVTGALASVSVAHAQEGLAHLDPDFRWDKSFAASLLSCASPVVSASQTGRPLLSITACILLVRPPRDRPMDCLLLRAQAAC